MRIILLPILLSLASTTHSFFSISPNYVGRRRPTKHAFLYAVSSKSLESLTMTELKDLVKEQFSENMGDKLKQRRLLRKLKQKQDLIDYLDGLGIQPKETESESSIVDSKEEGEEEEEISVADETIDELVAQEKTVVEEEDTVSEPVQEIEQAKIVENETPLVEEKATMPEENIEDAAPVEPEPAAEEDTVSKIAPPPVVEDSDVTDKEMAPPPIIETKEPADDQIAAVVADSTPPDMEETAIAGEETAAAAPPILETKELILDRLTAAAQQPTPPNYAEDEIIFDEKTAPIMKEEPTIIEQTPFVRYPPIAAKALEIIEEDEDDDEPAAAVKEEIKSPVEETTPVVAVEEAPIVEMEDTSEEKEAPAVDVKEDKDQILEEKPTDVEETSLGVDEKETEEEIISTPLVEDESLKPFSKVHSVFPEALSNAELTSFVSKTLRESHGYVKENTLLATSLCCDEVNRPLENDLCDVYGKNFNMGGLAGFPFGGATSFGAMAAHIPDGGSCVVVYGPHVGIDSTGKVGTVEREGRASGGSCCGSAVAASGYASSVFKGKAEEAQPPTDPLDAQQYFVGSMLLPHAKRLEDAKDKMVELPYALYDAQTELMGRVVDKSAGAVADGTIAVLGGIQINTPPGYIDYYLPLSFKLYDNEGELVEDFMQS